MARILTPLINEDIDSRFARLHKPFAIWSDVLGCKVKAPEGFIHDYESVPVIKGTSKRGGVIHDYLCRIDSEPVVTKKQAADVYLEVMVCRDGLPNRETTLGAASLFIRRWIKYGVVRVWPGYFHKNRVNATYEELRGIALNHNSTGGKS